MVGTAHCIGNCERGCAINEDNMRTHVSDKHQPSLLSVGGMLVDGHKRIHVWCCGVIIVLFCFAARLYKRYGMAKDPHVPMWFRRLPSLVLRGLIGKILPSVSPAPYA